MAKDAKRSMGSRSGSQLPGSLYRKRGFWYWKISHASVGRKSYSLVPTGAKRATKDRQIAVAIATRLWRKLDGFAQYQVSKKLTAWIDEFAELNAMEFSQTTAGRNKQILKAFCEVKGVGEAIEITSEVVQAYLMGMDQAPATVVKHRNAIRKFCAFLVRKGELDYNPADRDRVKVPRVYSAPPRFLDDAQLAAFLEKAKGDATIYAAALLAVRCGLRRHEFAALRGQDVRNGQVVVGAQDPNKVYAWRVVPCPADVVAALPKGKPAELIFPEWDKMEWAKRLRAITAGLPVFGDLKGRRVGKGWHLLRSTWAVNMALGKNELGRPLNLWEIMQRGGWKNPATVMKYVNISALG